MDPEDALKSQGRPETVDLTQAPTSPKPKKLKQMRLPFTRIHTNHASVADHPVAEGVTQPSGTECEKKRKHSSDGEPTPSKKEKLDGANAVEMMDIAHDDKTSPSLKKTPQRIAPTPIGSDAVKCKSPTVKKRITPTPVQNQAQDQVNSPKVRKTPKEAKTKKLTPKETKTKQIPKRIQPTLLTNLKIKSPTTSTSNDWTAATSTEKELKGPVSPSPTTGKNASDTPDGSTPKSCPQEVPCSPSVIEEYKRKIQVAIAKLSVETNELNEAMDQAAADKEFIKAANIKIQVDQITVKKDGWQSAFDEAKDDGGKLGQLLKTIKSPDDANGQLKVTAEPAKDFQTPKRKKAIQVKPPGSGGPSPGSAKKLTPKQEAKKLEIQKKKEEKEQERLEKERLKEEERVKKEEQRLEKERAKEEERLKKEEQRLEKIKAKKEKEEMKERLKREKEEEKKQKELERQQKEDAKQAEILEKQRKEEEKKKHEESEKIRLQKAAQSFSSFFIKKTSLDSPEEKETPKSVVPEHLNLFRVKKDMRLAPVARKRLDPEAKTNLDQLRDRDLAQCELYLKRLGANDYQIGKSGRTWPLGERKKPGNDDDDVEVIDDEDDEDIEDNLLNENDDKSEEDEAAQLAKSKIKAKLLQFDDNLRPAYWGTWSKTSNVVGPRRPFAQDSGLLDYEYDSGDDWEEEEPGESLSDAENDKEDDDDDDGEIADEDEDDGFFVGHGVLDKDEIHNEDDDDEESEDKSDQASAEEGASTSGKCGLSFDEEWEMKKQKLREQEFEREYFSKKKPVKLKPRVFGCMWMDDNQNSLVYEQLMKILQPFKVVSLCPCPIPTMCSSPKPSPSETNTPNSVRNASDTPLTTGKVKRMFPDEAYPDLVRLVHANTNGKFFLAKEFSEFWTRRSNRSTGKAPEKVPASTSTPGTPSVNSGEISKRKILETITEIADYKKLPNPGPMQNRMCWVVKEDVLSKFELESLPIPNDWSYILEQPNKFEGPKSAAKSSSNSASLSTPSKPGNDMAKKSIQSKFFTLVPKKKPTTQPADTVASKPEAEAPMEVVEAIVEENKDAPKSQSNV
ncbi:chromatin assembly factor 1 subunit A-B-like [Tigriopus californicus]|uniref:chromatin assembly factor 1 subunit A-B-like n=1 Tax=Tigriopus californicus TaxID=6832 RepID=UPI0027DA90D1|nr:chromatin assembly factor 1 subunit A-B-like [Tigriopus californicus]